MKLSDIMLLQMNKFLPWLAEKTVKLINCIF